MAGYSSPTFGNITQNPPYSQLNSNSGDNIVNMFYIIHIVVSYLLVCLLYILWLCAEMKYAYIQCRCLHVPKSYLITVLMHCSVHLKPIIPCLTLWKAIIPSRTVHSVLIDENRNITCHYSSASICISCTRDRHGDSPPLLQLQPHFSFQSSGAFVLITINFEMLSMAEPLNCSQTVYNHLFLKSSLKFHLAIYLEYQYFPRNST